MSTTPERSQDAITEEEIAGPSQLALSTSNKRNAFTELTSPKPKKSAVDVSTKKTSFIGRAGLGAYTCEPSKYPPSRVIYFNEEFVAINDLFPKSSIHTLLLWRSPRNLLHPFEAFKDAEFLARIRDEANKLRGLVAKELRRQYCNFSATERARQQALSGEVDVPDGKDLPPGRDWEKEVIAGVHTRPSMNHFHLHVLSVDRFSEYLKHKHHYNSFTTPFFVPIEEFPLDKDDVRWHSGREGYLNRNLRCWKCGKDFGKAFSKLKVHLSEEFEEWKRE